MYYWGEHIREVDFVLRAAERLVAIEVKSGRKREAIKGLEAFAKAFRPCCVLVVGSQGISLQEFLLRPASAWMYA